jgi:hypothetical protein
MKKLLLIFLWPLLVFSCTNSETDSAETPETSETAEMERSDWANDHLQGKVRTIEASTYTPEENGEISAMDSCCVEIDEFNDQGFIVTNKEMDAEGNMMRVTVVEYTETGQFLSATTTENGKQVWKRQIEMDEEGTVLSAYDSDSTQQTTAVYSGMTYNEYNQPLEGAMHTGDSTFLGTWSWQYIDGERVGRGWIDSSGVEWIKRVGEVNENGWVSKVTDYGFDGEGNKTTTIETYTYDSFDETGNWTQRTEFKDEKPVQVVKRRYTYY